MPAGFTENYLVARPALDLFEGLGWVVVSAMDEMVGSNGTVGREPKSEVVLVPRLRSALERLNPALPADATNSAIVELARDRSAMSLAAANRQVWKAQPAAYF